MPDSDRSLLDVTSGPLPYVLSLPSATGDGPRPVLVFLHGRDEAAPLPLRVGVTRHGPLRPGSAAIATREFVVIAPQLPLAGDLWHRQASAVRGIVEHVRREHGGDPARTYLTGFSFGGNGVFDLALAQPRFWAALWAVDPPRVPRSDVGRPAWLSIGHVARHAEASFVRALRSLPADGPAPTADRLHLDQGEDHVGSATRAYADERIYRWLLSRRLDAGG